MTARDVFRWSAANKQAGDLERDILSRPGATVLDVVRNPQYIAAEARAGKLWERLSPAARAQVQP